MNTTENPAPPMPAAIYAEHLARCRAAVGHRRQQHRWFAYGRLAWAVLFCVGLWLVFARHALAWPWLLLPWVGFGMTAIAHGRVLAAGARVQRAVAWYESGLARIEDRWSGLHSQDPRFAPPPEAQRSLFAADLDLFGPGSLFALLATARTALGDTRLAHWLLHSATPQEIRERQAAVAGLRDHLALREHLASVPGPDFIPVDLDTLTQWAEATEPALPGPLLWIAPLLTLGTLLAALHWALTHSPFLFLAFYAADTLATYALQRRLDTLFAAAGTAAAHFAALAEIAGALEAEPFTAPALTAVQAQLRGAVPASAALRRLTTLTQANVLRRGILRLFDLPLLYSVQLGLQVGRWRQKHGRQLRAWLEALAQAEALLSLSAFHFEHPTNFFPELVDSLDPVFVATGLGHPLLPAQSCVRNDVHLDGNTRLLLISGSNMSGKSTLLRAVGVNVVLACAGAPVCARSLRLSALHLGASIEVHDSLQTGRSRFYAEILRLRAIAELARMRPPALFLLDELLAGTNSHDRLIGATGLVRELLDAGAIGLLSTHDLALTGIAGDTSTVRNMHFEDRVEEDRLLFDYTLRDGIIQRSNGVELMRLIGLDV